MNGKNDCFDVYIGNLSVNTSEEKLRLLFSEIGQISSVWINKNWNKFTYGFITFNYLVDAQSTCEKFNNYNLDGNIIKVSLSFKTQKN